MRRESEMPWIVASALMSKLRSTSRRFWMRLPNTTMPHNRWIHSTSVLNKLCSIATIIGFSSWFISSIFCRKYSLYLVFDSTNSKDMLWTADAPTTSTIQCMHTDRQPRHQTRREGGGLNGATQCQHLADAPFQQAAPHRVFPLGRKTPHFHPQMFLLQGSNLASPPRHLYVELGDVVWHLSFQRDLQNNLPRNPAASPTWEWHLSRHTLHHRHCYHNPLVVLW
mmetsp:Transcript_21101/g.44524  ORF Transcript_21101/g.44524 Transcript_21101/m.44524 type:complete len:224 (+) Transcript_21101:554-1225(+)